MKRPGIAIDARGTERPLYLPPRRVRPKGYWSAVQHDLMRESAIGCLVVCGLPFVMGSLAFGLVEGVMLLTGSPAAMDDPLSVVLSILCTALWAAATWAILTREVKVGQAVASLMTKAGLCNSCGHSLHGLAPVEDGCLVCPECGAAWKS